MKKIIAIVALIASAQASAFWGWNDSYNSGYGSTVDNGYFDSTGTADAEADFSFDMTFSASMRGEGRGNGNGYGYNAHVPYYGAPYGYVPMAPVDPIAE